VSPTEPEARRRRRKRWPVVLACLLGLLAIPVLAYLYVKWFAARELDQVVIETDALDPDWRFDDLIAKRKPIPDDQNPALVAMKADALTRPAGFDIGEKNWRLFDEDQAAAQHRLNGPQIAALREALTKHAEAVKLARTLKDFKGEGRFPIKHDPNSLNTDLDPLQRNRGVLNMLMYDAMLRAEEEDAAGALQSCRALLVAARSIGQEPYLIALLIRVAGDHMLVPALERALAQGEPPADELKAIQELLAREIDAPILYQALRGERGGSDKLVAGIQKGDIKVSQLMGPGSPLGAAGTWEARLMDMFPAMITRGRPDGLRLMNKYVAAAQLPAEKQGEAVYEADRQARTGAAVLVRMLIPGVAKCAEASRRNQANLRGAACGVAAERFRLKHHRWPESLEELVKDELLDAVPTDPFDGRPMRLKAVADGIVIYSVGLDGVDNGGVVDRARMLQPGTDLGFRLWDVSARRQAPLPPPLPDQPEGPP
jgi:hypothetical protein